VILASRGEELSVQDREDVDVSRRALDEPF